MNYREYKALGKGTVWIIKSSLLLSKESYCILSLEDYLLNSHHLRKKKKVSAERLKWFLFF